MCGIMWDCKCIVMYVYGYTGVMWLCDAMISEWYIHVCYDLVLYVRYDLIMALYIRILCTLQDWNLYVVLNTTCSCIWCYVMLILVLCYVVMCVYVDNYVDNFNFNVDNFLLQMQHFYELFWKYYIFVYFRTLSLIISRLLSLSLCFVILL